MKQTLLILLISLFSKLGISQLTPNDIYYKRKIPGDSLLLIIDSMIVTKYQVYFWRGHYLSSYPNRPTKMKSFIKGYEKVDSISISSINSKIEIQLSDSNYLTDDWTLAVLKPKNKYKSFIYSVSRPFSRNSKSSVILDNIKILQSINVGDYIVITSLTSYHKSLIKLLDLEAKYYKVVD